MSIIPAVPDYILAFFLAGFINGLCVYTADNFSPYMAGYLAAFPVALISLVFTNKEARIELSSTLR